LSLISRRHWLVALLALAWILPGLVGHDPWKPDEAYTFGVVYELLRGGDWVVPLLAGEPFLDEPPLYYYVAAVAGWLFGPVLPLHDAVRLATGFCMGWVFLFCGLAGRELYGRNHGTLAVMLLLGCFGLVVRSHQLIADVGALLGFALAYYGFALAARRPLGGLWIGLGVGIVFMSQGLLEATLLVMVAAALPVVSGAWRSRSYALAMAIAAAVVLPWLVVWPWMLYQRSPELFTIWLKSDVLMHGWQADRSSIYYLRILPWYAWPVWALALWALWRARSSTPSPGLVLPLTGFLLTFIVLSTASEKRELFALPLLVPLALLATPSIATLRRGAANAWYWFSVMGFTFFIAVAWFYWSGLELGVPARLHAHLHRLQPGYTPGFKWLPFLVGLAYSVGWFAVLRAAHRTVERPAIVWAVGVTVVWGMLASLFMGWVDTGKSYRAVAQGVQNALPAQYRCIASRDLKEPQRAMLHYFAGVVTYREEVAERRRDCDVLLVQGRPLEEHVPLGGWDKIWEGSRPGDKDERNRLYQQAPVRARK
jgi:4-amino-4-deoxy-L-arabinose transferase-like glycosyltransferase